MFYYFEHYGKSPLKDFRPNPVRRTESLLKLYSMDEEFFLKTGYVRPNPDAVAHYTNSSGVNTIV
jgi:hypothetical protein